MNVRKHLQAQNSSQCEQVCNEACKRTLQLLKNIILQRAQSEAKLQKENNRLIGDLDSVQQKNQAIKQATKWKIKYEKQIQQNRQLQRKLATLKRQRNVTNIPKRNVRNIPRSNFQTDNQEDNPEQSSFDQIDNNIQNHYYDFQTEYKELLQKKFATQKIQRKLNGNKSSLNNTQRREQNIENLIKEKLGCDNYLSKNSEKHNQIIIKLVDNHTRSINQKRNGFKF